MAALESAEQRELLNTIDSLRQGGLESELELPQIVVCGDQSSGKSSVLEAITEVKFPTSAALCTRYATEVILRNTAKSSIETKIIPWSGRPDHEQKRLLAYSAAIDDLSELPTLIDEAAKEMGLVDADGKAVQAFSRDVLSLRVSGPDKPQLSKPPDSLRSAL